MQPRAKVRAVWHVRDEELEDAVDRVVATFARLANVAADWGNWFRGYKSTADREGGPHYLMGRPDLVLEEFIDRQREAGWEGTPDLGYPLTAAAGPPRGRGLDMSFLRFHCCVHPPHGGFNSVLLEFPTRSAAPALYHPDVLARAVAVFADVWDPDWAYAFYESTELVPPAWKYGPVLGWVTYVPSRIGVVEAGLAHGWQWFSGRGADQIFLFMGGPP